MDTLTITDLETSIVESLRRSADAHGRSVEEEAVEMIRKGLGVERDREALIAEALRISSLTPKGVVQTDSTRLIREDRDR
jgi:plasmid stability protein